MQRYIFYKYNFTKKELLDYFKNTKASENQML